MVAEAVSRAQIAQYHARGWVRLPAVIAADQLAALASELEAFVSAKTQGEWSGTWRDAFEGGQQFTLTTKHDMHAQPAWRVATTSPPVVEAVEALMGTRVAVLQSTAIIKPPQHGQAFPPHQDSAYYSPDEARTLVALFHLDDTTPENGPIRYLDGSHLEGHRRHVRDGKLRLEGVDLASMTEVCAQAGDLVCANIHTIHGSYPNRSPRARRLVRVVYTPA